MGTQVIYRNQPFRPKFIEILVHDKKGSRRFYDQFVFSMFKKSKSEIKWENILDIQVNNFWRNHNAVCHYVTKDIKLLWFQYRITHRIISTNAYVFKIGIFEGDRCNFCNAEVETICHIFSGCVHVNTLWNDIQNWVNNIYRLDIHLSIQDIIFSNAKFNACTGTSVINLVIILVKYYIYKQKLNKLLPTLEGAKRYIIYYRKLEEYFFKRNLQENKFRKKWGILSD